MKIGVFVCHCGTNISSMVNIEQVVSACSSMGQNIKAYEYKYMCSEPGQELIARLIREEKLERIVVAACSPRLHEKTFQKCMQRNGLNPYLVEIANIREQCSWVSTDIDEATIKAIDIVKSAIGKVRKASPLIKMQVSMAKKALIIGGGISGIQAALDIGYAGHQAVIVEREPSIGGRMAQFDKTFPTLDCAACILTPRMVQANQDPNIKIHTYSEVESVSGYVGNFDVKIRKRARYVDASKCTGCGICWQKCPSKTASEFDEKLGTRKAIYVPFPQAVPNVPVIDTNVCMYFKGLVEGKTGRCMICKKLCPADAVDYDQEDEIIEERFGAIIIATGFVTFDHSVYGEYGAGKLQDVITGLQFERMVSSSGPTGGRIIRPSDGKEAQTIVFVQCVGSRDEAKGMPYCSRVCCMYTAKHALLFKEHNPGGEAYVFYIDIRAAGKNYEEFVERVQSEYGVIYLRGRVSRIYAEDGSLVVKGADTLLGTQVEIKTDLVVLATGLVAQPDAVKVAQMLGVQYDKNRLFTEAHPKLAPVEMATTGIFLTGACQSPKDIPDTVGTASAAAAKALGLFSRDQLEVEPIVARVNKAACNGCFDCRAVCPFNAIREEATRDGRQVAEVIPSMCHGCGNCVTACRSQVIDLDGYTNEQVLEQIWAMK